MNANNTKQETSASYTAHAIVYAKGIAMGLGDSVPGISGGTIAVITNVFDKLIFSIRAVDVQALRFLAHGQFAALWRHINGNFLLLLALGILSGLLLSANTVLYLLDNRFEALMGFFIGLVFASTWLLKGKTSLRAWSNLLALAIGAIFTIAIGMLPQVDGNFSLVAIFISGAIAICAMILPGLSGAFILVLLGVYEYMLTSLIEFNFPVILVFMSGCVIGLLAFSRVLAWLLANFLELSYGFIIGMLFGSLLILWPWQHTQSAYTENSGEMHIAQTNNVLPINYTELTGHDPQVLLVLLSLLAGGALVLGLEQLFTRTQLGARPGHETKPNPGGSL